MQEKLGQPVDGARACLTSDKMMVSEGFEEGARQRYSAELRCAPLVMSFSEDGKVWEQKSAGSATLQQGIP